MTYTYNLTEEIARWAFEIKCKKSKEWYIAFTNPTAGPWKSMKCLNQSGVEGVIHRFGSEEERPDIVLINDKLKIIVIIEAKDTLHKLTEGNQCEKSVKVVSDISNILCTCDSQYWENSRKQYKIFLGLLWGNEEPNILAKVKETLVLYHTEMLKYNNIDKSAIITIITNKKNDELNCFLYIKKYDNNIIVQNIEQEMTRTLDLKLIKDF